jgi:hypothetical protein
MKKLLTLFAAILITAATYGQRNQTVYEVRNDSTNFGRPLPIGQPILDNSTQKLYQLTAPALATTQIRTATLVQVNWNMDSLTVENLNIDTLTVNQLNTTTVNLGAQQTLQSALGQVGTGTNIATEINPLDTIHAHVVRFKTFPHADLYFSDSTRLITLTQNVYSNITNANSNLFVIEENVWMAAAGDSIVITSNGDYMMHFGFGGSPATANDVISFQVFKNNIAVPTKVKSRGATLNVSWGVYLNALVAGDRIRVRVTNESASRNVTLNEGFIYIYKTHETW